MKFFDYFKTTKKRAISKEELSLDKFNSLDDLINTLSHYEMHTIVAALFYAAKMITLMDPKKEFKVSNEEIKKLNENMVFDTAKVFAEEARSIYEENKKNIDTSFRNHLN